MQVTAYLYSKQQDQKTIANQLNISQPQVSRLIRQALDQGLLIRRFEFNQERISKKRFNEIKNFEIPIELIKSLKQINSRITNVKIYDSGNSHDSYSQRLIPFSHNAASYLQDLFAEVNTIGITWGNTLSNLVDALARRYSYTPLREPKVFVPLCAELLGMASEQHHSTMIADRLNEIVNKRNGEHLSLSGIAAFIPRVVKNKKLSEENIELLWNFVRDSRSYRDIFEEFKGEEPFVDRLDCILTSISPLNEPLGPGISELERVSSFSPDDIKIELIQSGVVGDIGGVLLKRKSYLNNNLDNKSSFLESLEKQWTGITFNQMELLAKKAISSNDKQGIIVIAHGKNKAPVLMEAIQKGIVNQLVIDFELSMALKDLIKNIKVESN
ncbi:MAG: hypothetical protein IPL87_05320 [Candidatus Moraniibacteriota bacterium]|nr:MAG: hypothetical protein IPL87_05320 [Candidatus Moranbacteria bacterium]